MKENRSLLNTLVACGVALAMVSTLAAQTTDPGSAKVVRLKGGARYKAGNSDWRELHIGDKLGSGVVIQTAANSRVDLVLGDGSAPVARAVPTDMLSYTPTVEQNIVRIWENTLLGIDALTLAQTGADVVTDTQLDLKAGHITGVVKKMSAASKYEVKLPNGVAGIRGTIFDIDLKGPSVIKVHSGSLVVASLDPDGNAKADPVPAGYKWTYDAGTKRSTIEPMPDNEKSGMGRDSREMRAGLSAAGGAALGYGGSVFEPGTPPYVVPDMQTPGSVKSLPVTYIATPPPGFISPH